MAETEWLCTKEMANVAGIAVSSLRDHVRYGFKKVMKDEKGNLYFDKEAFLEWHKTHSAAAKAAKGHKVIYKIDLNSLTEPLHEDYKDYTEEELNFIKENKCQYCMYSLVLGFANSEGLNYPSKLCCGYQLQTHKVRPTRSELCQLYLNNGDDICVTEWDSMVSKNRKRKLINDKRKKAGIEEI